MSSNNTFNFIEVCSGAGGLSSGFINKQFSPLLLNDVDKHCCNTLRKNHPGCTVKQGSFCDLDLSIYAETTDVLMGGVPCQSFSQAGKRKGFGDERGNLFLEFLLKIDTVNPKVFLIENVKGLVTHNKGETMKLIMTKLGEKNYNLNWKVLNSNDYDVPQNRKRLIIVGVRKDIRKEYAFPPPSLRKPALKDALVDVPQSDGYSYSGRKKEIMEMVPEGGCWVDLPVEVQKEYMKKSYFSGGGKRGIAKRLDRNNPCLTLTTSPCQKQTEKCHPTETRPLSVAEYARIQTFPDTYEFVGSVSNKYKQIGNAVPVKLAEHLASSIAAVLNDSDISNY
jgi:DNA (cytosine-5)-methyltransferase 1